MLWRIMLWLNRKEVDNMAVIYVALIVKGKRTYASVPAVLKEQVKEMLIDLELEDLITDKGGMREGRSRLSLPF